ncbi:unnamed protein product [Parascedosporium putredinis]|uniref:alpha-glucosidase n=1 Tax=Parascedosporium putredinis TaxID=1442378 RepID=A0A9P1H9V7_9PEZI|nr:unnamed protein product [Parascedosporium putredinis]CAI8003406.1 unnamed protein product [Parascedosporium putredinis]
MINRPSYRFVGPSIVVVAASYLLYTSIGHHNCHSGRFCGAITQATFITPSGVEVPLNSINKDRLDDWASTALDPKATDPQTACKGYKISNIKTSRYGLTADLDLGGRECNVYGNDVWELTLLVEHQAKDRLHVEILPRFLSPRNESWYILPEVLIPKPKVEDDFEGKERDLQFILEEGDAFAFTVQRTSTGETLFTTVGSNIVFEDQFFEITSRMPEDYNLYGLGEVMHSFRLGNNLTTDAGDPIDENIYGSHPVYLDTRYYKVDPETGKQMYTRDAKDTNEKYASYTHGVFLRNAHPLEVLLRDEKLVWRGLGGTLDFYFYSGPTAKDVIRQYQTSTIGLPAMQQYWSLGFHQCRWGYSGWQELQKCYEEGAQFLDRIHENGQHFVPIVDSAIYAPDPGNPDDNYDTFDRGLEADAFMMNPDGSLYIGQVWPGYTVFPDWIGAVLNDSKTFEWWTDELSRWYQHVKFDGIWIDMSEVSSFCEGSCGSDRLGGPDSPPHFLTGTPERALQMAEEERMRHRVTGPHHRNVNRPPYMINNVHGHISIKAVAPEAVHHGGVLEYDVHNLFGHQILNATYTALRTIQPDKRPFIIGRSTFAGSGKWTGHWGAFVFHLWVPHVWHRRLRLQLESDAEQCARWMELAAFFPFYRNHNEVEKPSQEPYIWDVVAEASRRAIKVRYALLPYFYTLMQRAHERGDTVLRALAWEFPEEPWLADADRQFLVGPAILVTPVLVKGATTVDGVFPGSGSGTVWYDWYTLNKVQASRGENVTLSAPVEHIPVHVRGGHVVALQEPGMTTRESRQGAWELIVALDGAGSAQGELYIDDGESIIQSETLTVDFSVKQSSLTAKPHGSYRDTNRLKQVTVLGVTPISSVSLNGRALTSGWEFVQDVGALKVDLSAYTAGGAWSAEWVLSWT